MSDSLDQGQSLTEHLRDLRNCIVKSLYGIVAGMALCFTKVELIFDFLRKPIEPFLPAGGLVFTAPTDKFMSGIKISFLFGVILTCPWWLYQLWLFISPGLYQKEKKYAVAFISAGTVLFLIGAAFAYFLVLPAAFEFLMSFGGTTDKPMITISDYLGFLTLTILAFGGSFELPLIIVLLGMMGIVSQAFLRKNRRFLIMGLAVVSAIVTPPDLISMMAMLIPLLLLFELSILIVGRLEKKTGY